MFKEIIDKVDVTKYPYKKLMLIPVTVLIIALLLLGSNYLRLGRPIDYGMELEGGTAAYIQNITIEEGSLEEKLQEEFDDPEITVRSSGDRYRVEAPASVDSVMLKEAILSTYPDAKVSTEHMGATLGEDLRRQAMEALLYAFIGMTIVVFIVFRTPYPSIAVIISAFADIVVTAAIMYLLNIKLSLGTIAALLMMIGYSVDSDILLTTRLLKRRGKTDEKIREAMGTGLTMTFTTIAAMTVLFIVAYEIGTHILMDMAAILALGLTVDLMNTWMFNAGLLKWYLLRESSKGKKYPVRRR